MLKAIIASFIGTFLALAAIGVVAMVVVDRTVDRIVDGVTNRIEDRLEAARERAASVASRLGERATAAQRFVAFGACVEQGLDGGSRAAAAVASCRGEMDPDEP